MDNNTDKTKKKSKKKKIIWLIVMILCLLIAIGGIYAIRRVTHGPEYNFDKYKNEPSTALTDKSDSALTNSETEPVTEAVLPDSPIDFDKLQADNPDVYAWITVPGTKIDYPIVQNETSEEYYLRRDWLGNSDVCGCIFTQYLNKKDFTDRNTVIYGHYMTNKTFFGGLHDYRSMDFMLENPNIIIYTRGHKLTYEIFAAYEYDNRHILKSFDFRDDAVYEEYLKSCQNPITVSKTIKEGVTLTTEDKIVTLSTCLASGSDSQRFLVQGVLRSDELTK